MTTSGAKPSPFASLVAAFVVGAGLVCGAGSPVAAADVVKIRTMKQPLPYYAPFFIAAEKDFDKEFGIEIELVSVGSGAQNLPALVAGTLDLGTCTLNAAARMEERGKDVVAYYQLLTRPTLDLVIADRALKGGVTPASPLPEKLKLLKGLRFGISSPGSPSDYLLRILLKNDAGLDPLKDVQIIRVGSIGGLFAAMKTGQIDGYMLSPPSPQQAEAAGVGKTLIKVSAGELPSLSRFPFINLCSRADFVRDHPETLSRYVKAVQKGNDWMRQHPDGAIEVLQKVYPAVDPSAWQISFPALLPATSTNGRFNKADVDAAFRFYKEYGLIETVPDTSEGVLWTNQFLVK